MTSGEDNTLLPLRLNAEPAIFRGCTLSELLFLVTLGAVVWIPLCLVICALFGAVMMGVGLGVLATIGWLVLAAMILQKLKRGRPIGYYALALRLRWEDTGLVKSRFIRRSQVWDIGRSWCGRKNHERR